MRGFIQAQRRTLAADRLIASTYLAGTNTRRVRRALKVLFGDAVGKDTVSRVWRKVKADWDAWNARALTDEPIVRLILDGTVVDVRLAERARQGFGVYRAPAERAERHQFVWSRLLPVAASRISGRCFFSQRGG